jgi:hypothetical protein
MHSRILYIYIYESLLPSGNRLCKDKLRSTLDYINGGQANVV